MEGGRAALMYLQYSVSARWQALRSYFRNVIVFILTIVLRNKLHSVKKLI